MEGANLNVKIERALISVSNKTKIVEFAAGLKSLGIEIISTGGTYNTLKDAGIEVLKIDEITGFPEMLDGRVKTLHPFVHGGILANREINSHMQQIQEAGIKKIDLVVVNLYPFKETISKPEVKMKEAIENIDIGGPTMIRSAAKNSGGVGVVVDPDDYETVLSELKSSSGYLNSDILFSLSIKAFKHTCEYDSVIFNYFIEKTKTLGSKKIKIGNFLDVENTLKLESFKKINPNIFKDEEGSFNDFLSLSLIKKQNLRYGENPHQKASYYNFTNAPGNSFTNAKQLQGKELSYNNILDGNAAFNIVKEFDKPCVSIIKHNNPCGTAIGKDIAQAYGRAYEADPISAYGSVVACNMVFTAEAANLLFDKYVEVLIAPGFEKEALEILSKKQNLRVMHIDFDVLGYVSEIKQIGIKPEHKKKFSFYPDIKSVDGGLLLQDCDNGFDSKEEMKVVTLKAPDESQWKDLVFGWQVVKNVKSNAILIVKDEATVGVGAGQMSRVDSTKIAVEKSGGKCFGAVIASDAFFPFADAIEIAAENNIIAIIQPGGSVNDSEVIEAANRNKIAMVFTGRRHFKH